MWPFANMLKIRFLDATEGEFLSGIFIIIRRARAQIPKRSYSQSGAASSNGSEAEGWAQCKPR